MAAQRKARKLNDITEMLDEQLDLLVSGERTVAVAQAMATTVGKMFTGAKLQMEYARMLDKKPKIAMLD